MNRCTHVTGVKLCPYFLATTHTPHGTIKVSGKFITPMPTSHTSRLASWCGETHTRVQGEGVDAVVAALREMPAWSGIEDAVVEVVPLVINGSHR